MREEVIQGFVRTGENAPEPVLQEGKYRSQKKSVASVRERSQGQQRRTFPPWKQERGVPD